MLCRRSCSYVAIVPQAAAGDDDSDEGEEGESDEDDEEVAASEADGSVSTPRSRGAALGIGSVLRPGHGTIEDWGIHALAQLA